MQDIDIYYESIKQVYSQIKSALERKQPMREKLADWFVGVSAAVFLISLIPILPILVVFAGSIFGLILGPISLQQVSLGEFVIFWISFSIITLAILALALWINAKVDSAGKKSRKPSQTLSPEQLTFITVYEAYKELKIYFVSHIDQHVENSLMALRQIIQSTRQQIMIEEIIREEHLGPAEAERAKRLYSTEHPSAVFTEPTSLSKQVAIAQEFLKAFEKYAWLQIDQSTKLTLQALISFPDKVFWRLSKREDLPSVLT